METARLGSILIGSARPDALRDWYRAALAPGTEGDGPIELGGMRLIFDGRDDVAPTNPEPGRLILNFYVDDVDAVAAHLTRLGVTWLAPVEQRPFGRIGTVVDPDGNYLQVAQLAPAPVPAP